MVGGRVTVIIPSYNRAEYLHEAIKSALDQDYPDVEVLVADDSSSDSSVEVALSFGNRIRVLRLPHGGISLTRNRAILASTGEYVAFLDCDDVYLPSRISATVAALRKYPDAALAFCDIRIIDAAGNVIGVPQYPTSSCDPESFEALFWCNRVPCVGVTARKQAILDAGLFDPKYDGSCEDYDLWLRLRRRHPFVYVAKQLALHRRHTTNTSTQRVFALKANERRLVTELAEEYPQFQAWLPCRLARIDLQEGFHHLIRGQYWRSVRCCLQGVRRSPLGAIGFVLYLLVYVAPERIRRLVKVRARKSGHRTASR